MTGTERKRVSAVCVAENSTSSHPVQKLPGALAGGYLDCRHWPLLPSDSRAMRTGRLGAVKQQVRAHCNGRYPAWHASMHEQRRLIVVARYNAVALGIALEYAQHYSGSRDFEIGDLVADVAGVG